MANLGAARRTALFICNRCKEISQQRPLALDSRKAINDGGAVTPNYPRHSPLTIFPTSRYFHASSSRLKKKDRGGGGDQAEPAAKGKGEIPDPFDFQELQAAIAKTHTRLKDELARLKPGGAFNPEQVESLRIRLRKDSKDTVRLGDVAQCVPRGRTMMVIVGEQDYVKPVSAAIYSSSLSLTPEKDQENPLQLNIKLPAPTTETRQNTVKEAAKVGDAAKQGIANARSTAHKHLQNLKKTVRPDDWYKASEKMEKVVADANAEAKRIVDSAKKVLEHQ